MIGANREAATRALKELREEGAVGVRNHKIHVVNVEVLRQTAG